MIKDLANTIKAMRGYKIVHIHSPYSIAVLDAMCAFFAGAKIRIIHSRSSNYPNKMEHMLLKPLIPLFANRYFAVSGISGEWMFSKSILNSKYYKQINNAINTKAFLFNSDVREKIRQQMNLEESFIIGHIGRFSEEKNHMFLLEVFYKIQQNLPNAKLLLIGDGGLRKSIENRIKELKIADKVILLGIRNDVPELLQAADLFVLPSVFEGLPGAALEAQAAGLKTFLSDAITTEVNVIKDLVEFLPIDKGIDVWADRLVEFAGSGFNRRDTYSEIVAADFDIETVAKWYENFYLSQGKI